MSFWSLWKKRMNNHHGLTLIEILIVVVILSVILAIVIPNYTSSTARAEKKLCHAKERMVEAQIELYRMDNGLTTAAIISDKDNVISKMVTAGYLKETPACPNQGTYTLEDVTGTLQFQCSEHLHYTTP